MIKKSKNQIEHFLDENIQKFTHPCSMYGKEPNSTSKNWDDMKLKVLMMSSWTYRDVAGNQSIPLVARLINDSAEDIFADRSFFPFAKKDWNLHKSNNMPPFGLNSRRCATDFDILATSVAFLPFLINVVQQLKMCQMPVLEKDRRGMEEEYPIVMLGGYCFGNPECISPAVDIVWLGEAEDEIGNPGIGEVMKFIRDWKEEYKDEFYTRTGRDALLFQLHNTFSFLYIPRFHEPVYDKNNLITSFIHQNKTEPPRRRYVHNFDAATASTETPISYINTAMGMGEVEATRGCVGSCAFCAQMFRAKPYRERSVGKLIDHIKEAVKNTGSVHAYPCLASTRLLEDGSLLHEGGRSILYKGKQNCLKVNFCNGTSLIGTADHLVNTLDDGWISIADLQGKRIVSRIDFLPDRSYLTIPESGINFKNCRVPAIVNEDLAWFLGFLYGDGWIKIDGAYFAFGNKDENLLEEARRICENLFGVSCTTYTNQNGIKTYRVCRRDLVRWMLGTLGLSVRKETDYCDIPLMIRMSPKSVIGAFISGLMDADGTVSKDFCECYLVTAQESWANQICDLIVGLGCKAKIYKPKKYRVDDRKQIYWVKILKSRYGSYDWLKFRSKKKIDRFNRFKELLNTSTGKPCKYDKFNGKILEDSMVLEVLSIESVGCLDVYDVVDQPGNKFLYGGMVVHNCAMDLSMYSQKNLLVKHLLEKVSSRVDTQSARVDNVAQDPCFLRLARVGGMKQLVLGVEGVSQRMRDLVNKNASVNDIVEACRKAMISGFRRIKFFFICNLPFEDEKDFQCFYDLMKRIKDVRDAMGAKVQLFASFTPLRLEANTPFQWMPIPEAKMMGDIPHRVRKELGIKVLFGPKVQKDMMFYMNLLGMADRKIGKAFIECVDELDMCYWGGISKDFMPLVLSKLDSIGFNLGQFFAEKPFDYVFPWEIIDVGVKKDYLRKYYDTIVDFAQNNIDAVSYEKQSIEEDRRFQLMSQCRDCGSCQACTPDDRKEMTRIRNQKDEFFDSILPIQDDVMVQKALFKVELDDYWRFLESHFKTTVVRRFFYQNSIPIAKNSILFESSNVKYDNYCSGVDYFEVGFASARDKAFFSMDNPLWLKMPYMKILKADLIFTKFSLSGDFKNRANLFSMRVPTIGESKQMMDRWRSGKKISARLKMPGKSRSSFASVEVNLRDYVYDLFLQVKGAYVCVNFYCYDGISPYEVYSSLFDMPLDRSLKIPARRIDVFRSSSFGINGSLFGMCESCSKNLEMDLFGDKVHDSLCYKCQAKKEGLLLEI